MSICGSADQSVTAAGSQQSTTLPHVLDIVIQCSFEVLLVPPPLVVAPLHFPVRQLLECPSAIHSHPRLPRGAVLDITAPVLVDWPLSSICAVVVQPPRNMLCGSVHKSRFLKQFEGSPTVALKNIPWYLEPVREAFFFCESSFIWKF